MGSLGPHSPTSTSTHPAPSRSRPSQTPQSGSTCWASWAEADPRVLYPGQPLPWSSTPSYSSSGSRLCSDPRMVLGSWAHPGSVVPSDPRAAPPFLSQGSQLLSLAEPPPTQGPLLRRASGLAGGAAYEWGRESLCEPRGNLGAPGMQQHLGVGCWGGGGAWTSHHCSALTECRGPLSLAGRWQQSPLLQRLLPLPRDGHSRLISRGGWRSWEPG